jgi:hypothetical protein
MVVNEGDIIKHERFMDVALLITEVTKRTKVGTAVHGEWVNLQYVWSIFIGYNTRQFNRNTVLIRDDEPWYRLTNHKDVACWRYGNWEKM